ncbi:MAG: GNAT family N-acetyltransferase [Ignavibacteriae bacterium]|nr:GNAT family N-acetyltransferase [Ignavibacteriota bacterium]MCB9215192.1 GNAT family N-acetyltransferase [Ignavibacteria bacterium]
MAHFNVEDIKIRLTRESTGLEVDQIQTWLREYNWSENREFLERVTDPNYAAQKLILFAEVTGEVETAPQLIGGLIAETQLSWLRVSIMATDPEWRSRGIGKALLSEAERIAVGRGCRYSYVDTMSYQAPSFYEANGYSRVGTIPDWDSHGHAKMFFVKEID